jgi:hypothetical protein
MKIGELFIGIKILSDLKALTTLQTGLTNSTKMAIGLKDAVYTLSYGLTQLVSSAISSATELNNLSIQTDISITSLQNLKYLAGQNFISFNTLKGALLGVQQAVANIRLGQGNIRPWSILGINPLQEPTKILSQLRQKTQGLPTGIAMNLMSQMGISPEMIVYLRTANGYFDQLTKKFMLTNRETGNLLYLSRAFKDLGFSIKGASERLLAMNFEAIVKFISAIKNSVTALFMFSKYMTELSQKFKLIQILFATGFTAGLISMMVNPFTRWLGILIAIVSVLDDLFVYFTGSGKSAIGFVLEKLSNLKNPFQNWLNWLKPISTIFETIETVLDRLTINKKGGASASWSDQPGTIKDALTSLTNASLKGDILGISDLLNPEKFFNNVITGTNNIVQNINFVISSTTPSGMLEEITKNFKKVVKETYGKTSQSGY